MVTDDELMPGGNTSGDVVRVGSTVRKPWTPATPSVIEYMTAVRDAGVDVPAALGRDDESRAVFEFVPGQLALDADPLTRDELCRAGALVRSIHDASASFVPPTDALWITAIPTPGDDLICHNDLAPWNLLIGERWVFIDWDAAAPSTRIWDLAYAAQAFALSDVDRAPDEAAADLSAFVDGYSGDGALRRELPAAIVRRTDAMLQLLAGSHEIGVEPWRTMYVEGHGEHWRAASEYARVHEALWARALLEPSRER